MGYPLSTQKRFLILGVLLISISISIAIFYPATRKILSSYTIDYYIYNPKTPVKSAVDTAHMPPAIAVPILMYHGVVHEVESTNTNIDRFIEQMEMLKRNGYTTISVTEYDLFRQGKFTLPPRPIIITFDDGRKDSYYTTDDVFKKLGFKATIFVASGMALDGNSFYLTWDELKELQKTGRWEIEAHGRYSHKIIQINKENEGEGRYLTSKMYLPDKDRVETTAEFEKRVEQDYLDNLYDLNTHLGIQAHYFAIPLNDYGQQPIANYLGGPVFNQVLIRKYFRDAFIVSNDPEHVQVLLTPAYNFKDTDPYKLNRIEVKNMRARDLEDILRREEPVRPRLTLESKDFKITSYNRIISSTISFAPDGLHLRSDEIDGSGKVIFGEDSWRDYEVSAMMTRATGRSIVLMFNYLDDRNYIACGVTDNGVYLRSVVNNVTKELVESKTMAQPIGGEITLTAQSKNGIANCYFNGQPLFLHIPIPLERGAIGVKVWDDTKRAEGILHRLEVIPL
jgi:peptidoglycan/xylan/chitin deacetylase (PgdA/CDA1 family)